MSEIKSKKAEEYLEHNAWKERPTCPLENVRLYAAQEAVAIAETEAEQRHAKEMQELKDRIFEACQRACWVVYPHDDVMCCDGDCAAMQDFTKKLNAAPQSPRPVCPVCKSKLHLQLLGDAITDAYCLTCQKDIDVESPNYDDTTK